MSLMFASLLTAPSKRPRTIGPRGGWRQRYAAEDTEQEDQQPSIGKLAPGQLQDWCDGWLSSYRLCKHMRNAVEDKNTCKLAQAIGKIANVSHPESHCNEGMFKLLHSLELLANAVSTIADSPATHFIKPTAIIRIFQQYPREFRLRFGADADKVRSFWDVFFSSDIRVQWAQEHSFLKGKAPRDLTRTIPLVLHQDAGPCSKTKSADCICFSSLLGEGSEKLTKWLLATFILDKSRDEKDTKVWQEILENLNAAMTNGCGEWFFCTLFAKADEEQRSLKWGLPSYNDIHEICSECMCNRSNRPYTDLSRNARWRPTESMTKQCYRARICDPKHPLATSLYFTRWCFSWTSCTCSIARVLLA